MINVNILEQASLFLFIAKLEDIEAERQRLEAHYGVKLAVFDVEHPTLSGARATRVTWAEAE
jgi:hypothetical protein